MKKILMALVVFASVGAATAQTKPSQKKADTKKECHEVKKECTKESKGSCCMSSSRAKALLTPKKSIVKKG